MSIFDKAKHTAQNWRGKAKEAGGHASADPHAAREGRNEQTKAHVKKATENIKDAFKR